MKHEWFCFVLLWYHQEPFETKQTARFQSGLKIGLTEQTIPQSPVILQEPLITVTVVYVYRSIIFISEKYCSGFASQSRERSYSLCTSSRRQLSEKGQMSGAGTEMRRSVVDSPFNLLMLNPIPQHRSSFFILSVTVSTQKLKREGMNRTSLRNRRAHLNFSSEDNCITFLFLKAMGLKNSRKQHDCPWCCVLCSVMTDSLQPRGFQPARLLCPWDFPGKNTGRGCHFPLQDIFPTQGWNPCLLYWQADSLPLKPMLHLLGASYFSICPRDGGKNSGWTVIGPGVQFLFGTD